MRFTPRLTLPALALASAACARQEVSYPTPADSPPATYAVRLLAVTPAPRFAVRAELRGVGDTLRMATTRPGDAPEILRQGWPALVSGLRVSTPAGGAVAATSAGAAGWVLGPHTGTLRLEYEVDYALLARQEWPAPREAAYADGRGVLLIGRSLFAGLPSSAPVRVAFEVPDGWHVSAPWPRSGAGFTVAGFDALTANLLAFTRQPPRTATVGDLTVSVVSFGAWRGREDQVLEVLRASAASFTSLFGEGAPHTYLAAFLEGGELAGEAFLDSYAMHADPAVPRVPWARIVAHELFHYWNGQRLRGADYTASQWFQEGISEYYALLASVRNGFLNEAELLAQLSERLHAGGELAASLAASGNRKNAAFYGRATITAMLLDLELRAYSGGERSLDDVLRALWRDFGSGGRSYALADAYAAVAATGGHEVARRLTERVETTALPNVESALAWVGLELSSGAPAQIRMTADATPEQQARWRRIVRPAP